MKRDVKYSSVRSVSRGNLPPLGIPRHFAILTEPGQLLARLEFLTGPLPEFPD